MLESMRKAANSWAAKFLLGLVALSFISWGAQRKSVSFGGLPSLAKIGSTEITETTFGRAFDNEIKALSQRARRPITASEARAFGLDRQVLSRLIGEAAIDNQAKALGLSLSDATMAETIQRDPNFKDINGKFDRAGFEQQLQNNKLSEKGFFALKRQDDIRSQLVGTLVNAVVTPQPIVTALHNWKEENRIIEHFTLDAAKAVTVPAADPAKLKEVYAANLDQFMAPEYRKLQILLLSVDDLKKQSTVTDAEIATSYDETKEDYATPERRRVQMIAFKDKAEADAAKAALDGGKNFMTLAEERGLKASDLESGLVTRKAMRDKKLAAAAFAIEKDKVSGVVDGDLAYIIFRIPEIETGKQPSLDEVKERVKEKLARSKAKDEVQKLRDQADDLRNAAKSDKEIAEALKLKLLDVEATDSANKAPDDKTALDHPDAKGLIAAGFDTKAGVERDPVDLADGGYGWVNVAATTPARQKPFDEVEAGVKTFYEAAERKRLLLELSSKLIERLNKGESFETIATELGTKIDKTIAMTRTIVPQGLTEGAVKQAFSLPLNHAGSAETNDRKSRAIFRVAEIKPAEPMTKEQSDRLIGDVTRQVQADAIDAYVAALQDGAGVRINEAVFRRLSGAETAQ